MAVRECVSRGYTIAYEDVGDGPAVALVHGWGWPASVWREGGYVDGLTAAGYRVLAVDPLGHGLSDGPDDWRAYTAPGIAADVVAAVEHADAGRAAVWGYSRGAWLAVMAAAEFVDRVSAVVAGGLPWVDARLAEGVPATLTSLAAGDWDAYWRQLGVAIPVADRLVMEAGDARALAAVHLGRRRSDYELGRLRAPVFLYYGAADAAAATTVGAALGVEPHILAGEHDHSAAYSDVGRVLPVVLEFLASELSG